MKSPKPPYQRRQFSTSEEWGRKIYQDAKQRTDLQLNNTEHLIPGVDFIPDSAAERRQKGVHVPDKTQIVNLPYRGVHPDRLHQPTQPALHVQELGAAATVQLVQHQRK